jgi:hypothetical protein
MPFITQVLLPKHDNLGRPFRRKRFAAFHGRMIRKFGGWTRKGLAEGAWLSVSGTMYSDEHWVYEIGHARPSLLFWTAEKERLKAEFEQEEIWIIQYHGRAI